MKKNQRHLMDVKGLKRRELRATQARRVKGGAIVSPRDVASGQATGIVSPRDSASGLPTGK